MASEPKPVLVRFLCCARVMPFDPAFDAEGFLICPEHGQRRYGWRSARLKRHKAFPFDPDKPQYVWRPDYSETRLEQDQDFSARLWPQPRTVTWPHEVLSPAAREELEMLREYQEELQNQMSRERNL